MFLVLLLAVLFSQYHVSFNISSRSISLSASLAWINLLTSPILVSRGDERNVVRGRELFVFSERLPAAVVLFVFPLDELVTKSLVVCT